MVTARNINEYRAIQQKRINKFKEYSRKGPITSAKFMALMLRRLAPCQSGRVISTIRRNGSEVSVSGVSDKGFPYIHWINATPGSGLERIKLVRQFRPVNMKSQKEFTFLQVAKKKYTAGFFWTAQRETRKHFRDSMLRYTRNTLRGEF